MALVVKSPVSNRWNARFLSFKKKKKNPSLTFFTRKPLKVKNNINIKKKKAGRSHYSSDGINTVFIFVVEL